MVSAVWAMLATNTRDRQIITLSESGDPAIVCVCVCVLTHPQLICSLFFTDTICLCFILSETTLFTLEISLSQQQLPALFFNLLFSFVVLHADESQKSGLPPRRELRLQKNHDAAGRCPLEGNEQLRATPVRVFCRST